MKTNICYWNSMTSTGRCRILESPTTHISICIRITVPECHRYTNCIGLYWSCKILYLKECYYETQNGLNSTENVNTTAVAISDPPPVLFCPSASVKVYIWFDQHPSLRSICSLDLCKVLTLFVQSGLFDFSLSLLRVKTTAGNRFLRLESVTPKKTKSGTQKTAVGQRVRCGDTTFISKSMSGVLQLGANSKTLWPVMGFWDWKVSLQKRPRSQRYRKQLLDKGFGCGDTTFTSKPMSLVFQFVANSKTNGQWWVSESGKCHSIKKTKKFLTQKTTVGQGVKFTLLYFQVYEWSLSAWG